jgi:hypothetical protein
MREKVGATNRRSGFRLRIAGVVAAGLIALTTASSAWGAVTIGQLAPGTSPPDLCTSNSPFDEVQPTVTSGNSYVVPALPPASALVVSSWSINAGPGAGASLKMKMWRKVAGPLTFQVVGHDGFRALTPSTVNTFKTNIPVQPGDVLGVNDGVADSACAFAVPGETFPNRSGDLADGQSGAFPTSPNFRLNMTAVVEPSNTFTVGKTTLNKKKGTATIGATVPNVGQLSGSGKGAKVTSAGAVISKTVTPGNTKLVIRARGKKRKKLNDTGKVKLNAKITYTPTGGTANTLSKKVKLKRNL